MLPKFCGLEQQFYLLMMLLVSALTWAQFDAFLLVSPEVAAS